jgi:acyl carrier protein
MAAQSQITEILTGHPGVRRAETATVVHDGREVIIAVVEPSEYLSGPILRDYVRQRLTGDGGPAGVLIVEHLPVDASEVTAAITDGRCTLFEDPRDDVERRLAEIWSKEMDVRSVSMNDDFLELGGDSLSALGIIAAIETEFDRSLDVYEFMTAASVRRLADLIRQP